jgi:twitching motility protein PilT
MSAANAGLFGRVALASKLISADQLQVALHEHSRNGAGRHLGQVLVDLGMVSPKQLEQIIELQKRGIEKARAQQVSNARAEPPAAVATPAEEASASAPAYGEIPLGEHAESSAPEAKEAAVDLTSMHGLLRLAVQQGASDIHVHTGTPIRIRARGRFGDLGGPVIQLADAQRLIGEVLSDADRAQLETAGEVDFAFEIAGVTRVRANAYRQLRGLDAAFRLIPAEPPSLESLGLPNALARLTTYHQGMVLVTGPARCGKSSTLAALVRLINEERSEHILTIEDPIEYRHVSKRCLVNQRSVKRHTESFARALRAALREDPDIIVIGELRDPESIALAMTAAETGHFVLGTLHTDNAIRTINRIIGAFAPEQHDQIRSMLSESLRAVVSQRLLPTADGAGQAVALEVLINNLAIGNLIRENKTIQLRSVLQTGGEKGMYLLDQSLGQLVQSGRVSAQDALRHCEDPRLMVKR